VKAIAGLDQSNGSPFVADGDLIHINARGYVAYVFYFLKDTFVH